MFNSAHIFFLGLSLTCLRAYEIVPGVSALSEPKNEFFKITNLKNIGKLRSSQLNGAINNRYRNVIELSQKSFEGIGLAQDMNALEKLLGIETNKSHIAADFLHGRALSSGIRSKAAGNINLNSKIDDTDQLLRSRDEDTYISNPRQAHCEPELKPVDLGFENTHEVTYYPTCVRVKQCGGCCPKKDIFSCQPIATKKKFVKVLKIVNNNNENQVSRSTRGRQNQRRRRRVKIQYDSINVTVEEHTNCNCMCKLKEGSCNPTLHNYDENTCSCTCKNSDEEEKCFKKRSHYWSSDVCKCQCRKVNPCSSNYEFDHNSCTCKLKQNTPRWRGAESSHGQAIVFPDNESVARTDVVITPENKSVSESEVFGKDFTSNMNSITKIKDFVEFLDMELPSEPNVSISVRFGSISSAEEFEQARCVPQPTVVTLDLPLETGATFFPTCVRVPRCGGCCFVSHHSCQPTATEKLLVKVLRVQNEVIPAGRPRRRRVRDAESNYISVELDKHTECECKCRLQESECNPEVHDYNSDFCTCTCRNSDEEAACFNSRLHFWDNDSCKCKCRRSESCTLGRTLDKETCRCVASGNNLIDENLFRSDLF